MQAIVMLGALGIFTMLVAWHGDGQEVTRHTIEGFAEVRVCVLILFLVGVLRLIPARRRPLSEETASEVPVPEENGSEQNGSEENGSEQNGSEQNVSEQNVR
jgi:hypothetical protein